MQGGTRLTKIDIFAHILPPKYFSLLQQKVRPDYNIAREKDNRANTDLDTRLRLMERFPDVLQIISVSQPPLEMVVGKQEAIELARVANDELADLVARYPKPFAGAVACLPMNDIDAALQETDRAIKDLKLNGVQIYTNINGETLDNPKFRPLYAKMAEYDLPIWIHPCRGVSGDEAVFGWPYETSSAMLKLVASGVFQDYPEIKFVMHHAGAMVSFFERRIRWLFPLEFGTKVHNPAEHFRKFYCDTAIYGSTSALHCAYEFFGADHLLFGTDCPLGPNFGLTGETIRSLNRMQITEAEREKIFAENAVRLLRLAI
jgi:aminocarboxymuconate-semialdehyde decarboxylase